MEACCIDHITITSPSLEAGAAFVRQALGVDLQKGGEHPRMGTHNLLLRLGDALFLEVISVNPNAVAPSRPRWFGLDRLAPDALPSLSTWVVRTRDIRATAAASSEPLGNIAPMSRGALNWLITIPDDGEVPLDGVAPALIEWHADVHPASVMEDRGVSLRQLEIFHPDPERVSRLMSSLPFDGPLSVRHLAAGERPHLVAHLDTPHGPRTLSVPGAVHGAS
ncbi:MAG TPA: VOC family protein [Noviherbaspirillum sp.]